MSVSIERATLHVQMRMIGRASTYASCSRSASLRQRTDPFRTTRQPPDGSRCATLWTMLGHWCTDLGYCAKTGVDITWQQNAVRSAELDLHVLLPVEVIGYSTYEHALRHFVQPSASLLSRLVNGTSLSRREEAAYYQVVRRVSHRIHSEILARCQASADSQPGKPPNARFTGPARSYPEQSTKPSCAGSGATASSAAETQRRRARTSPCRSPILPPTCR